ncbi:unnamed protein product [Pipistrellus nathusii]|uniref:Secreted protein n=1 Tax=Pipistrellus nathusii TaxID=59473 RepID=A0ABN9Z387_PIPNA
MHCQVFFSLHALIWFCKIPATGATKSTPAPQTAGQLPRFPTSQLISSVSFPKLSIPRLQKSGTPSRNRKVANLVSLLNHLCNKSAFAALPQSATYVSQGLFYLNCIFVSGQAVTNLLCLE